MTNETARYIIKYFSHLLTDKEAIAINHTNFSYKIQNSNSDKTNLTKVYRERGYLTSDETVLDLLKDGYDHFEFTVANRILIDNKDKVFFNNCSKCGKLARTPEAKQCRHCGNDWH